MKKMKMYLMTAILGVASLSMVFTSCNPDECKDVVCNTGVCNPDNGECDCPIGYEGTACEVLSRDKFIGTYQGNENCTVGTDNYSIQITSNSDDVKFNILNLYNQSFTAIADANGNAFTIPSQTVGAGVTASGSGTISGNDITITYAIDDGLTTNTCTYEGTR